MAWWAPWTWLRGNREEPLEEEALEEEIGFAPEFPAKKGTSWLRPWTWFGRGEEELEEIAGVSAPPTEKGALEEEFGAYPPKTEGPELGEKLHTEEEFPELGRERPSKKVLVEEEELGVFPPREEEEYPGGLYISDTKVEGGFKKFCFVLFSIFLLPFILVFGVCLAVCAFLLIYPIIIAFFPIFLVGLLMLFIIIPVAVPVLIIYIMVTERSTLLINSKGRLFSLQSLPSEEGKIPGE
ncbi:MAG TPA: hypothetical protein ACFYD3_07180 [Candidatus Hypogeohydataceae bacterium YC41]